MQTFNDGNWSVAPQRSAFSINTQLSSDKLPLWLQNINGVNDWSRQTNLWRTVYLLLLMRWHFLLPRGSRWHSVRKTWSIIRFWVLVAQTQTLIKHLKGTAAFRADGLRQPFTRSIFLDNNWLSFSAPRHHITHKTTKRLFVDGPSVDICELRKPRQTWNQSSLSTYPNIFQFFTLQLEVLSDQFTLSCDWAFTLQYTTDINACI